MKNITNFNLEKLLKFDKIWCLVSGGIDSTYLFELISERFSEKTYPVNCWNPYEQSKTLRLLKKHPLYIEVKPATKLDYKKILDDAFSKIPDAILLRKRGNYHKKIFPCCKYIKHQAFKKDPLFQTKNTVVISGIKRGDGQQRSAFLYGIKHCIETTKNMKVPDKPTFFYTHREGQHYCYPFRDYKSRELPGSIIKQLKIKYPGLKHSGCSICPVLVVFADRIFDPINTPNSLKYYHKMVGQKQISDFNGKSLNR